MLAFLPLPASSQKPFKGPYVSLQIGQGTTGVNPHPSVEFGQSQKGGGALWGWALGYNQPLSACEALGVNSPICDKIVLGAEVYGTTCQYKAEQERALTGTQSEANAAALKSSYGFAGKIGYEVTPTTLAYVGVALEKVSLTKTYTSLIATIPDSVDSRGYHLSFWVPRIGIETKVTDSVSVRLQYEGALPKKVSNLKEPEYTDKITFSRLTLGAAYHF